jgi:hypothetical protein
MVRVVKPKSYMKNGTKIGIIAAFILAGSIVSLFVILYHTRAKAANPNRLNRPLTAEQAVQAKQTAQDFFDALGKQDWDKMASVCQPGYALGDMLNSEQKDYFKGLQVLSLGEPFKKSSYGGVYVPYRIRFRDGEEKEFNLAVRNDNPKGKWYFDGGF